MFTSLVSLLIRKRSCGRNQFTYNIHCKLFYQITVILKGETKQNEYDAEKNDITNQICGQRVADITHVN
jgi:hypothetical protein